MQRYDHQKRTHRHHLETNNDDARPSCLRRIALAKAASSLDWLSGTRLGQLVLLRLMRTLHTFELTVQWMWPNDLPHHHATCPPQCGEYHRQAKIDRPLAWCLFLPAILLMRMYRFAWCITGHQGTVIGHLQSAQRHLRIIRYEGLRRMSSHNRSVLQSVLFRLGWKNSVENLNDSEVLRSLTASSNIDVRHLETIEDLMERSFNSDGESSDSDYVLPSDALVSSSEEYDSETDSNSDLSELSEPDDEQEERPAKIEIRRQKPQHQQTHQTKNVQHQPYAIAKSNGNGQQTHAANESTSGVESMDAQNGIAPHRGPSSGQTNDIHKNGANTMATLKNDSESINGASPKRVVHILHSGSPDTPTITLDDHDHAQNNAIASTTSAAEEPHSMQQLRNYGTVHSAQEEASSSSRCDDPTDPRIGLRLRSIENFANGGGGNGSSVDAEDDDACGAENDHHGADGFGEPEMSKSKRRRLKKKLQQQQSVETSVAVAADKEN